MCSFLSVVVFSLKHCFELVRLCSRERKDHKKNLKRVDTRAKKERIHRRSHSNPPIIRVLRRFYPASVHLTETTPSSGPRNLRF